MDYLEIENFFEYDCRDIKSYVFKVKAKEILPLYYVAVRGKDTEEGAVQRVLSPKRIADIANYVLKGNVFMNTFIMNWANADCEVEFGNVIKIPKIAASMQVIDGQHRLEGIKAAYSVNQECGDIDILVVLTNRLTTELAAEIFLNINYQQKQVPKSLVYDLFGEIRDPDYNIARARDLSIKMNNDVNSPYYQCVKMPGTKNKGRIDLSTFISAIKEYLKDGGIFETYNITSFEMQYGILNNFFFVIKSAYGEKWLSTLNPFLTSAGYFAAIKFFCEKMIPLCASNYSFEIATIQTMLRFDSYELLLRDSLKNQQGKEQRASIYKYLLDVLTRDLPTSDGYKF